MVHGFKWLVLTSLSVAFPLNLSGVVCGVQTGVYSALPHLVKISSSLTSGLLADCMLSRSLLSTTHTRKLLTAGERWLDGERGRGEGESERRGGGGVREGRVREGGVLERECVEERGGSLLSTAHSRKLLTAGERWLNGERGRGEGGGRVRERGG